MYNLPTNIAYTISNVPMKSLVKFAICVFAVADGVGAIASISAMRRRSSTRDNASAHPHPSTNITDTRASSTAFWKWEKYFYHKTTTTFLFPMTSTRKFITTISLKLRKLSSHLFWVHPLMPSLATSLSNVIFITLIFSIWPFQLILQKN